MLGIGAENDIYLITYTCKLKERKRYQGASSFELFKGFLVLTAAVRLYHYVPKYNDRLY